MTASSAYDGAMRIFRRLLIGLTTLVAVLTYVWVAAVRAVPGVRARKAAARSRDAS
jgi:hypothetical protein